MFAFSILELETQYFKHAYNLQVFVEMGEIQSHKAMTTSVWNQNFTGVRTHLPRSLCGLKRLMFDVVWQKHLTVGRRNCYLYILYSFDPFGKKRKKTEGIKALGSSFTCSRNWPKLSFSNSQSTLQIFYIYTAPKLLHWQSQSYCRVECLLLFPVLYHTHM